MRVCVFALYTIGMLTFVGLFLQNANLKSQALNALRVIPEAERSVMGGSYVDFSQHWLTSVTGILLNLSLWFIWLACSFMLFAWQRSEDVSPPIE